MYYRLTYTTSSKDRKGNYFLNAKKPLSIGQSALCDVKFPESDAYEPQVFASILTGKEGNAWFVVKRSDCCRILINEEELHTAQFLKNGDSLTFIFQENSEKMLFQIHDDGDYDERNGILFKKQRTAKLHVIVSTLLVMLVSFVVIYNIFTATRKDIHRMDWTECGQAIFSLTVDSVYLLCDSVVDGREKLVTVEAIGLKEVAVGTAFLTFDAETGDTLFVTARHCVEPWINDEEWDGVSIDKNTLPEVRLATTAETKNKEAGCEKYVMRAHCVLSKGKEKYEFYSTDFCMNKSRDLVMRLGTPETPIYWRTIIPIAHRRDMELGDFAYVKAPEGIKTKEIPLLPLADWNDIVSLTKSSNKDVAILGYPLNDNGSQNVTVVMGNYMETEMPREAEKPEGCLKLSAPLNRGHSGGPIFSVIDNKLKIIGIVSKADGRANQGMFWFVPVTEVTNMHRQGDTIEEEESYRR